MMTLMVFYVRKSVKAGPFRFNMSKSGVGVSVGVPGFRVGTGPRGNYVHVGRGGVLYRSSLNSRPGSPTHTAPGAPAQLTASQILMEDVTGATALEMVPTGGGDIVEQLNKASHHFRWAWIVTVAAFILGAAIMPWGIIVWALAVPLCSWLFLREAAKRKVVLFYDVTDAAASWFDGLVDNWSWFRDAEKLWRIVSSGQVNTLYQHKTNAGASDLVKRVEASAGLDGPKHLATNVAVPSISVGKSSIHFLPDRVLLREDKTYSDVSYRYLEVRGSRKQFIESPGPVPKDSERVGQTWQYVNKKGGPDGRFSNNPILPIMLYGELDLTSHSGLSWRVQSSRSDAGSAIAQSLQRVPREEVSS